MCLVIFSCSRTHVQPEGGSGFSVQITDKGAVSFLFVIGEGGACCCFRSADQNSMSRELLTKVLLLALETEIGVIFPGTYILPGKAAFSSFYKNITRYLKHFSSFMGEKNVDPPPPFVYHAYTFSQTNPKSKNSTAP